MKRQIATLLTLGLILVATFPATIVSAQDQPPPVPHAFFGSVQVNGQPAPVGASVEARGENVLIGNQGNPFIVTLAGQYGGPARNEAKLIVQGRLQDDQPIEFYVNGVKAQCAKPGEPWQDSYPFIQGVVTQLNLKVGTDQQQVESSPTPTATQGPPAQATSTATQAPPGQASVTEPTAMQVATATRQAGQPTTVATTAVPTATGAQPTVVESSAPQATPLPGALVTVPTQLPTSGSATASLSPAALSQPAAATVAAISTMALTAAPTESGPTDEPSATPAQMAAQPNATAQPILSQAKPPETVQSTLSETANSGSTRRVTFWAGLGLVLIAVAVGVLIKVRGLPR